MWLQKSKRKTRLQNVLSKNFHITCFLSASLRTEKRGADYCISQEDALPLSNYLRATTDMVPIISIIIPCYGAKAYAERLAHCKASIEHQCAESSVYELIIVTDGEGGLGGARNRGIEQARGEFLMFVDADDLLTAGSLPALAKAVKESMIDIFAYRYARGKEKTFLASDKPQSPVRYFHRGSLFMQQHNFTGSACLYLFRRSFVLGNHLRFTENCYHEDEEFVALAFALAGEVAISDLPVYHYLPSPEGITRAGDEKKRQKRTEDFLQMLLRLQQRAARLAETDNERGEALTRRLRFLTIDFLRQQHRNKATRKQCKIHHQLLYRQGLLPLPRASYGWKYRLARLFINLWTNR